MLVLFLNLTTHQIKRCQSRRVLGQIWKEEAPTPTRIKSIGAKLSVPFPLSNEENRLGEQIMSGTYLLKPSHWWRNYIHDVRVQVECQPSYREHHGTSSPATTCRVCVAYPSVPQPQRRLSSCEAKRVSDGCSPVCQNFFFAFQELFSASFTWLIPFDS